jgi:alpha-L-rhamnosidase
MNSFNHYAYGAVGEWIYSVVGGIDLDPEQPGYKHIFIRPRPSESLTHARATLESMYGRIESEWHLEQNLLKLKISIPANTTATVQIATTDADAITEGGQPAGKAPGIRAIEITNTSATYQLGSGQYAFQIVNPTLTRIAK